MWKKSVMHVQSCCFANLNLSVYCFVVLVTVAVVVAIQKFGYHGNLTSHFSSLFNALNKDTSFVTVFLCPLNLQSVRINGVWLNKCYSAWLCLPLWSLLAFSSSVSLHMELILIVICEQCGHSVVGLVCSCRTWEEDFYHVHPYVSWTC